MSLKQYIGVAMLTFYFVFVCPLTQPIGFVGLYLITYDWVEERVK
jgi:hypothetical protein